MGFFSKLFGLPPKQQKRAPINYQQQQQRAPVSDMNPPSKDLVSDIREILKTDFSQYEIKEQVGAKEICDQAQFGGPADFVLIKGGKAAAVVMLIPQNKFRTKRVWGVEMSCNSVNIPFIKFYYHFPFSREHASRHIAKKLPN